MHKKGQVSDLLSGWIAIIALVFILVIAGYLFFGPQQLFKADKNIIIKGEDYTESTRVLTMMKHTNPKGIQFADCLVAYNNGEYNKEKLMEEAQAYMNKLPTPKKSTWEFKLYKNEKEIFKTIATLGYDIKLKQSIQLPIMQNPDETLKAELYLRTYEEDLEQYA